MLKSPEQFDFSKLKDQQKFDKLPDDKKQELIEKSHEEAFKVDKEYSYEEERKINWDDQLREIKNTGIILSDFLNQTIPLSLSLQNGLAFRIKNFKEVYNYLPDIQLNHLFFKKLNNLSEEINNTIIRGEKQINKNTSIDIYKVKEEDLEFLRKKNNLIRDLINNYYKGPGEKQD
ncbi:MAG: hypothetical protein AAB464_02340 [Patescibacteria group bacterium]